MAVRRRTVAALLVLSVLAGAAGGYGALYLLFEGHLPWRFSLPWQQMESLLEGQVLTGTALEIALDSGSGRIDGEAALSVVHPGGDGSQVVLLLNPGLAVSAITCDADPVSWRRQGERLVVQLPSGTAACTLTVTYGGLMTPANGSLLALSPEAFLADRLQFWYPLDLKNFGDFSALLRIPDGWDAAWSGTLLEDMVADGSRTVRWKENRPVLAVGLAAGRFQKVSRVQGGVRCNVFGARVDAAAAEPWLAALGESYNYFRAMLGADGFGQVNLVVAAGAPGVSRLGGPVIVCPPGALKNADDVFAILARQVAQNWWGDTVSGRWFSSRPEAGEWLVSGMSEYCAWQALRSIKGRRAYLRHMEQLHYAPELPAPMKSFNLGQRLRPGQAGGGDLRYARGPYIASTIAQYIGRDAFERACRNFMAVHRYTTVSYAALIHEMTLASEKPLDELVRVWFDRTGAFDYAVSDVVVEGGRVHVTIQNKGDIPACVPMDLGLVTVDGYQVYLIEPGVQGDSVSFPLDGVFKRVVLDPEFSLGDMRRANNTWPPTQWPMALDVSRNGRIAMLSQTEWGDASARRLFVFSLADKAPEYGIQAAGGAPFGFHWDPDGQQLAVQGATPGVWRERKWNPGGAGAVFLGWDGGEPVYWSGGAIVSPPRLATAAPAVALPPPVPGLSAIQPKTGVMAYVTGTGLLVLWDARATKLLPVRDGLRPAGDLRWRGDRNALLYFDEGGAFVSLDLDSGAETALLQRNYHIGQSKISERGAHVAWVDPAGLLRAFTPDGGEPVYISLPGEVVDFAWEGEDALIAIVATVPRRLPMRFHADFTLWRIPATTWRGVQLPYDPVQFTAAASEMPVAGLE